MSLIPVPTTAPHPRSPPRASAGASLAGLVALLTLMTLELVRTSGPLLDLAYSRAGVTGVAGAALITYLAPGVVAVLVLLTVRGGFAGATPAVLLVGSGLLGALRLVVQGLEAGARVAVGLATVAVGVAVLTLAVAVLANRPAGGRAAAGAVSAGAAAGVGLQLALGTWDAYWRHTALGWAVTVAGVSALVWLAVRAGRDLGRAPSRPVRRLWVLGPTLALGAMMLANPAFAASQSGVPLAIAGPITAAGLLLASWSVTRPSPPARAAERGAWTPRSSRSVEAAVLVLLVAAALSLGSFDALDGVLALLAILGAQVTAIRLLGGALEPAPPPLDEAALGIEPGRVSLLVAGTASLVGLGTIVPLLVYQVDYDIPLGFPNELVLVATAATLGGAGLRRTAAAAGSGTDSSRSVGGTVLAASGTLALVGTVIAGAAWVTNRQVGLVGAPGQPGTGSGRVVSWNVHYGVSAAGSVDLEAIARTIEAQDPDAVLLQEVSRGWVLGGGVDMATWLSNRLSRQFAFAPAADRRFGNLIMSREKLSAVDVQPLPYGTGPQNRSAISARVRIGTSTMEVTSVHLQQRAANTATRMRQLETLLADLGAGDDAGPAKIVGGDFNAGPGRPEIALMTDAGFTSAVDAAGDPAALTSPSTNPTRRIDWVFGRGVTFGDARVLAGTRTSDHLPLVVTAAPRAP